MAGILEGRQHGLGIQAQALTQRLTAQQRETVMARVRENVARIDRLLTLFELLPFEEAAARKRFDQEVEQMVRQLNAGREAAARAMAAAGLTPPTEGAAS